MQNPPQDLVTEDELCSFGLTKVGDITHVSEQDNFQISMQKTAVAIKALGVIYVWVIEASELGGAITRSVGYVGFTSANIFHRRSQWQAALNKGKRARKAAREASKPAPDAEGRGAAIARMLKPVLASGATISIWYRHSGSIDLFGETVSLAKCEEDALIKKYKPKWNWSGDEDQDNAVL